MWAFDTPKEEPEQDLATAHCLPLGLQLQPHELLIGWRILPIPPAPGVLDLCVIDVRAIGQKHIGNGALVFVEAVRLL